MKIRQNPASLNSLRHASIHFDKEMGLDHLAYEMYSEHMSEVLAEFGHRVKTLVIIEVLDDSLIS